MSLSLADDVLMESFLISTGVVALAEVGDKTQLLAFMLAARFCRPVPIILGILVATLANHALAGALGVWVSGLLGPDVLRWVLGLSFLAMAAWILIPDHISEDDVVLKGSLGAFGATLLAFFLAEMGDKTQIATVALAAHYKWPLMVILGTTLGMMIANVPAVLLGRHLGVRVPMRLVHMAAASIFALLGVATLVGLGEGLGF